MSELSLLSSANTDALGMSGLQGVVAVPLAEHPRIALMGHLHDCLNDLASAKFELRLASGIQRHCHVGRRDYRHFSAVRARPEAFARAFRLL